MTRQRQIREAKERDLRRHVDEHNSRVIPDQPGMVRTEGPRRQFRAEVRNGELHYTEL